MTLFHKVFVGLIMLAGLGMATSFIMDHIRMRSAASWPKVQGEIKKSGVKKTKSTGVHAGSYWAHIRYTYKINGKEYTSTRVYVGPRMVSREEAREMAGRYTPGGIVEVYVDPEDPAYALLDPDRAPGSGKWKLILGLGFCLAGLILMVGLKDLKTCHGT